MKYSREIEKKYILPDIGFFTALYALSSKYPVLANESSIDRFWKAPGVDFIRARLNSREITVKVTDKDSIIDRIEENVVVIDFDAAIRLLTLVHGEPVLTQVKKFLVVKTPVAILCLYQVVGDPEGRVFFESEADTEEGVDKGVALALEVLQTEMIQVNESLFQIFAGGIE